MGGCRVKRLDGRRWKHIRLLILQRDGFKCRKCKGRRRLQVDHIVPLARGGAEHPRNYQLLCFGCHVTKTAAENSTIVGKAEWIERVRAWNE